MDLFDQFIQERVYLKGVSPQNRDLLPLRFQRVHRSHGFETPP